MTPDINVKVFVTVKKENAEYSLICNSNANLGEAYSAWQEIGVWIVEKIKQDLENRKPIDPPKIVDEPKSE